MNLQNKIKIICKCIIFTSLLFDIQFTKAQNPYFKRVYINRENSSLKFTAVLTGKDGFIWFGSTDGVYKFDGTDQLLFAISTPGFDNTVSAMYTDSNDTIWVGYKSGKIAFIKNNQIHLFEPQEGFPAKAINCLSKDAKGNLWVATAGEGVYYFSNGHLHNINSDDGLNDNYTYTLAPEKGLQMWVGTDDGLALCEAENKTKVVKAFHTHDGLPDNIVRVLTRDPYGGLWIGMQEKGICKFIPAQSSFVVSQGYGGWAFGQVNSITFDRTEIWVGTEENGLIHFDPQFSILPRVIRGYNSFRFSKILNAMLDREGNLWMIANANIYQSTGSSILILDDLSGIDLKMVHTLMFDHKGNLWFTPDQGLVSFSINDTSPKLSGKYIFTPEKDLVDIVSLYEDDCNYIWAGTMGEGIFRLNPQNGKIQKISIDPRLNNASIMSIDGKEDEIWIATLGGAFHLKLPADCNSDHILPLCTKLENESLLGNFYIYDIFVDSKGRTWFGTDGKGITCIDHGEYFNYNEKAGLKNNAIYSITEDKFNNIWFSTMNAGIYKFNGKTFKNYNQASGLRYTSISGIITDKKGNLIVVHRHGFDVLDIENESFIYYGSEVGIPDINSDLNALARDKNGRIWIGTEDAIISYNYNGNSYSKKPFTIITKASLFTDELDQAVSRSLSYDKNYLSFDFSGIWFSNPDRVKYQYMLEGYNKEWIPTKDKKVIFPNLPPGKYTFKVRTSLNKNFKHFTEATYSFGIRQPVWKENWFLFMSGVIVCGIIYVFIRLRVEQVRRLDTLRNEKIEFQYETLKSQVNPHFLFNSFNTLITVIEEDKNKAIEYVETLSAFFRNIVAYKDHDLIHLYQEIEVATNYYFLQKKRYMNNLTMDIQVSEEAKRREIPPMVLQILVENAIKHNAISHESPLHITIGMSGKKLEVKNNINSKRTIESSTKSGLQNIINRFRLLTSEDIEIINDNVNFIVRIPLL